jgi:hypothetical protein
MGEKGERGERERERGGGESSEGEMELLQLLPRYLLSYSILPTTLKDPKGINTGRGRGRERKEVLQFLLVYVIQNEKRD